MLMFVRLPLKGAGDLVTKDMEKSMCSVPFTSIFTGKTCLQESQAPDTNGCSEEGLLVVEDDQAKEHLNRLNIQKSMGPDEMRADIIARPVCCLWKVMMIRGGSCRLQQSKSQSCLQEGQGGGSRELLTDQPHLDSWEGDGANPCGSNFQKY